MQEPAALAVMAEAILLIEFALHGVLRILEDLLSGAPPGQDRALQLAEPVQQPGHRLELDRPTVSQVLVRRQLAEQLCVELEKQVQRPVSNVERRQVREEIVADEEAEEDKVCDQRSSFMCRNEFRP